MPRRDSLLVQGIQAVNHILFAANAKSGPTTKTVDRHDCIPFLHVAGGARARQQRQTLNPLHTTRSLADELDERRRGGGTYSLKLSPEALVEEQPIQGNDDCNRNVGEPIRPLIIHQIAHEVFTPCKQNEWDEGEG